MRRLVSLVLAWLLVTCLHTSEAQVVTPGIAGESFGLPKVSGRFYFGAPVAATTTNQALGAANRLYASPFYVGPSSPPLKTLSFNIGTGNASAWNARMCVYTDNHGVPDALMADTGTVAIGSGSVTGVQTANVNGATGISAPGWVWVAFMADNNSESLFSWTGGINTVSGGMTFLMGQSSVANITSGAALNSVFVAQAFGSCPSSFGAASLNSGVNAPALFVGF